MEAYQKILSMAINREVESFTFYKGVAVFTELASMERGHKVRLEDIYTNMAFPEAW